MIEDQMANVYIVQLRFYDATVTFGAHSTLELAKDEIDRINCGNHKSSKTDSYDAEWDRSILIRKLDEDHNGDDLDEISYREKING